MLTTCGCYAILMMFGAETAERSTLTGHQARPGAALLLCRGAGGSAPRLAAPRSDAAKRPQPLPRAPEAPTHAPNFTLLARPRRGLAAQAAKGTRGQATASGSWATLGAASRGPRGGRPRHPTCFGAFGWPTAYRLRLPALCAAHPRPHPISTTRLRGPRRDAAAPAARPVARGDAR